MSQGKKRSDSSESLATHRESTDHSYREYFKRRIRKDKLKN